MPSPKPLITRPQRLGSSRTHYKFQGKHYKHLDIEIKLASIKTIAAAILLGVPYLGFIYVFFAGGAKIIAGGLVVVGILIAGSIALLYHLNRQESVKPPTNQNKQR